MAQKQMCFGFSETLLQTDESTFIRVHNRQHPQIEFIVSGRKITLTQTQWENIDNLSNNIQLAFTLLAEGKIGTLNDTKRKRPNDDTFDGIIESLGL